MLIYVICMLWSIRFSSYICFDGIKFDLWNSILIVWNSNEVRSIKPLNDVFVKFLDWLFPISKLIYFDVIETMKFISFIRNFFKLNFIAIYETCDGPVGWDLSHCIFLPWATSCFLVFVRKICVENRDVTTTKTSSKLNCSF